MAKVSLVLFTDVPSTCGHSEYAFRIESQYLCKVFSCLRFDKQEEEGSENMNY